MNEIVEMFASVSQSPFVRYYTRDERVQGTFFDGKNTLKFAPRYATFDFRPNIAYYWAADKIIKFKMRPGPRTQFKLSDWNEA